MRRAPPLGQENAKISLDARSGRPHLMKEFADIPQGD
jgi:hypothetical protein